MNYILSLDQGTTSSRAVLFDENAEVRAIAQREFTQYFPQVGWVEHDPMEIWQSQRKVMLEAVKKSGADPRSVKAIGITNQRETTIVWERASGRPIFNAIVWQCRRTAPFIEKLIADGLGDMIKQKTGLVPDAYFSAAKIRWILDNVEGAREKAVRGELCFGTVDSWLIYNLTGGKVHAIDRTNASRTMLYNIGDCRWDDELPELLGIPCSMLPEVRSSGEVYGVTDILGCEIPIAGVAGDQQAALFGQCCWQAGDVKNTYGTGCFMLMNTGSELRRSGSGLVTTISATLADEPVNYALEGSVFVGGAVIQWLRDEMKMFGDSAESESLAAETADNGGVYFVPAFTGLGAPYWDMYARGAIFGITRGTSRGHIVRAALESIAYQSHDLFTAISQDAGRQITRMSVDGGACCNRLLMQFQSDISNIELEKPISHESTALGAAFLAGLTVGLWRNRDQLKALRRIDKVYSPSMSDNVRGELLNEWHKAVGRSVGWAKKE